MAEPVEPAGPLTPAGDDDVLRVRVSAPTLADLRAFADDLHPDLGCRAVVRQVGDEYVITAYLTPAQLTEARHTRAADRVSLDVVANESVNGRQRQQEVGTGDRYAARGEVPRGLGRKE
jgi:hypothetical protein